MVLLSSTYSQNVMKKYLIWLKTERENIFFHYIDFNKIAATVPLSLGAEVARDGNQVRACGWFVWGRDH